MKKRAMGFTLLVTIMTGCGESFSIYSPSQIHRTVQSHQNMKGFYTVDYKWVKVINEFSPDTRKALKNATTHDVVRNQGLAEAVPKYLEAKGIVPSECVNGVVVTSSGVFEGGGGVSIFRCKN